VLLQPIPISPDELRRDSVQRRWRPATWITLLALVLLTAVPVTLAAPAQQEGQPPDTVLLTESNDSLQPGQASPANDDPEVAFSPDYLKLDRKSVV